MKRLTATEVQTMRHHPLRGIERDKCMNKQIDKEWFLMVRKGFLTLLCHQCKEREQADVACWDERRAVWYCDTCSLEAPPLVDFIAMLYPATQMRVGTRL